MNKAKLESEKAEREYDLLCSVDHPNIMKAFLKWKTSNKTLKIGLEYLPCRDLK